MITVDCAVCGQTFWSQKVNAKYCSKRCRNASQSENMIRRIRAEKQANRETAIPTPIGVIDTTNMPKRLKDVYMCPSTETTTTYFSDILTAVEDEEIEEIIAKLENTQNQKTKVLRLKKELSRRKELSQSALDLNSKWYKQFAIEWVTVVFALKKKGNKVVNR